VIGTKRGTAHQPTGSQRSPFHSSVFLEGHQGIIGAGWFEFAMHYVEPGEQFPVGCLIRIDSVFRSLCG
jgi:hypothetical protein